MSADPARHPIPQQTLGESIQLSGVGLMTGVPSTVALHPAAPGTGILFVRTDLPGRPEIPLPDSSRPSEVRRSTGIERDGVHLQTVEHLLSALAGMGIDNVRIEIDAEEPPILDGSALPFVEAIRKAGIVPQEASREPFEVAAPIVLEEEDRQIVITPAETFRVTFVFDRYGRPGVESQIATFDVTPEVYEREIAPARTFCFEDEVEALRAAGLGKGASPENVLLVTEDGPKDGDWRLPDEMVRHKILDLIGDLYVGGRLPRAHVLAVRSHHALNVRAAQKLLEEDLARREAERVRLNPPMSVEEIERILPHRYPFLLVDRVLEIDEGKRVLALKNVSANEPFFRGHFPGHPIMPGVLITEALAQAGGVLLMRRGEMEGKIAYFMTIENAKFRKPVVPGDQLLLEVEVLRLRRTTGKLRGTASVEDAVVAEAEFTFAIVDREATTN